MIDLRKLGPVPAASSRAQWRSSSANPLEKRADRPLRESHCRMPRMKIAAILPGHCLMAKCSGIGEAKTKRNDLNQAEV
jgi:hypothetical protein